MDIQLLREPGGLSLEFPVWFPNLILLAGYILLVLWMIWHERETFRKLDRRSGLILAGLILLVIPAYRFLVIYWARGAVIPPGPMNVLPFTSSISLLGILLVAAVTYGFGAGPGLLASLVAGLAWARYTPLIPTDVLALAMWGYLAGALLYQRYRGDVFRILRQPLAAFLSASFVTVCLLSLSRLSASRLLDGLRIIDFVVVLWSNELPLWLVVGALLGGIFQLVALNPDWRLVETADQPSFYSRSLSAQFMVFSVPLVVLSVLFSVFAVTNRSVRLAQEQSLQEMQRSTANAGESIRQFYITGRNVIDAVTREPRLLDPDPGVQAQALDIALNVVPYFQQLLLVQATGDVYSVTLTVPATGVDAALSADEINALGTLQTHDLHIQETRVVDLSLEGVVASGYSVLGHVDVAGAGRRGHELYVVGRAAFNLHPEIQGALAVLQKARTTGVGFVVDDFNWIVAHPEPARMYTVWTVGETSPQLDTADAPDLAYEAITANGEHVLVYVHELQGLPHRVVLELPYIAVLETAAKTAGPLLFVQVVFGLLLSFAIPIFASRMTRPLNALALAAHRIARGNLTGEVHIEGDDEAAQLGDAFERMRVRLRARLDDLSLLLSIAQEVSATLNLERGIVPILEGARTEVDAALARFVILRDDGRPRRVFEVGEAGGNIPRLDQALGSALMHRKEPLIITNLDQTQRTVPAVDFKSVAAFPVRSQERTVGVLWVGLMTIQEPDEARINFLSTLASQAAVLMENARLFQTAEGGRQRLAAILASTRDAILVVDSDNRLLLTNPAAQRLLAFGREAIGRPVDDIGLPEPLVNALASRAVASERREEGQGVPELALGQTPERDAVDEAEEALAPPVEVPMEDGRTFYASIAPIRARGGVTDGVVVVMRDVTYFKEVDEMKSEFVATVSHDLKAPLTFMRGYTTMLPMVGTLNERQQSYVERILEGIEQMSTLIGDLLDLRRVEAGVGIDQNPCRLGLVLVEAVEAMRARAIAKDIDLSLEPSEGAPTIIGDRTLLRQAISNLVDNAIKYTPEKGAVNVGLDTSPAAATIRISDTGIGIAPEEQPRLFEKFHRIQRREMAHVKGTGLGLALVKSIVDRHGGRVWVESALNKGSTFYVELPIPDEDGASSA